VITIRRLTPTAGADARYPVSDPRQRVELVERVGRTLPPRAKEDPESYSQRVDAQVDRLTPFWRTVLDLEFAERACVAHTSDYDPFAGEF
jgi:hypothetical protein